MSVRDKGAGGGHGKTSDKLALQRPLLARAAPGGDIPTTYRIIRKRTCQVARRTSSARGSGEEYP